VLIIPHPKNLRCYATFHKTSNLDCSFCTTHAVEIKEVGWGFYIFFFWSRLIPTLFLILGWGYQPERVQAGIYLLFYALLASLPLLVGILFIYNSLGSLCLLLLSGSGSLVGGLFYVCIVFAFLVRIPIFIVHLWLPRAHVEAPVSGLIWLRIDTGGGRL